MVLTFYIRKLLKPQNSIPVNFLNAFRLIVCPNPFLIFFAFLPDFECHYIAHEEFFKSSVAVEKNEVQIFQKISVENLPKSNFSVKSHLPPPKIRKFVALSPLLEGFLSFASDQLLCQERKSKS